jgi:DNA-binding Xre family transcriptional regulator
MSIDKVRGTDTLTLRLTKEDKAALDELVEAERVELAARGVAVSIAQYVRGLIRAAYAAMVARRPAPAPAPAPTPPATVPTPAPTKAAPAPTAAPTPPAAPAPTEAQVRRKLQASKLTQADLARRAGIDAAMLSRFANGKKPLSPEKLARLAVELDR